MSNIQDITTTTDLGNETHSLNVAYRFKRLEYLVADKYGNLYNLEHCNGKRTSPFKMLDKARGYVYYNRIKYPLSRLRTLAIKQNHIINPITP